jgi:hypothetical protein
MGISLTIDQVFFAVSLVFGQAYFIFKLVRIWQQSSTIYLNVSKSLTVFDALSILSLMACFVWSILVYRDFGKGLKGAGEPFLYPTRAIRAEYGSYVATYQIAQDGIQPMGNGRRGEEWADVSGHEEAQYRLSGRRAGLCCISSR